MRYEFLLRRWMKTVKSWHTRQPYNSSETSQTMLSIPYPCMTFISWYSYQKELFFHVVQPVMTVSHPALHSLWQHVIRTIKEFHLSSKKICCKKFWCFVYKLKQILHKTNAFTNYTVLTCLNNFSSTSAQRKNTPKFLSEKHIEWKINYTSYSIVFLSWIIAQHNSTPPWWHFVPRTSHSIETWLY